MKTEHIHLTQPQTGTLWLPDTGTPKLILHVIHGMTEHIARYTEFAKSLTEKQIAVAGFDLPGHGVNATNFARSTSSAVFLPGDWENSLNNIHAFQQELHQRFPYTPHVLMGFSLGSFLLRDYLSCYSVNTQGIILMGTGDQPAWILKVIIQLVKHQAKKLGYAQTTPFVRKLSVENYNKHFRPNRTDYDWLCSDTHTLQEYIQDNLCQKEISAGLFLQLLQGMYRTGQMASLQHWEKHTPVLLLSGKQDPVGDFGKGVRSLHQKLQQAGFISEMHLIPEARHDILHEKSCFADQEALKIISSWLSAIITIDK